MNFDQILKFVEQAATVEMKFAKSVLASAGCGKSPRRESGRGIFFHRANAFRMRRRRLPCADDLPQRKVHEP